MKVYMNHLRIKTGYISLKHIEAENLAKIAAGGFEGETICSSNVFSMDEDPIDILNEHFEPQSPTEQKDVIITSDLIALLLYPNVFFYLY